MPQAIRRFYREAPIGGFQRLTGAGPGGTGGDGGDGGAGGGAFVASAVNFDGTNDYLTRGGDLTGQANSNFALISLWFKINGGDAAVQRILSDNGSNIRVSRDAANKISLSFVNSAGTLTTWGGATNGQYSTVSNPGWHHLLISLDGVAARRQIYIDDVAIAFTTTNGNVSDVGWNNAGITEWAIGAFTNGTQKANMDLAEMYINQVADLDISVEANRRKFISAALKPVSLGAGGSTPTGTAPIEFFSGPTVDWHTNKGSGGGFTETGALTDASSSPSD